MAYAKRIRRKPTGAKKPTYKRFVRKVATKRIANIARSVINRNTETKVIRWTATQQLYNATANMVSFYSTTGNMICLSPHSSYNAISQGTTDSARIGNKVQTQSCMLRMNIIPKPYNATNNPTPIPFYVKIWIFELPYDSEVSAMQSVINSNFFDSNSSSTGMTSGLSDLTGVVNKNIVRLKKVIIRKVATSNFQGTGALPGHQYFANNDYKLSAYLNLNVTKLLKKTYKYNDAGTIPYACHTWCCVEPIAFNNDTSMVGIIPAEMLYTLEYKYKDV